MYTYIVSDEISKLEYESLSKKYSHPNKCLENLKTNALKPRKVVIVFLNFHNF